MNKAKRRIKRGRPANSAPPWPFPDHVHMTAHPSGQWCKKIKGRLFYFGAIDEPELALLKWQQQHHQLERGELTQGVQVKSGHAHVTAVCQNFIKYTQRKVDSGETTARTLNRYKRITETVIEQLGGSTLVRVLGPNDFIRLRQHIGETFAPSTTQQMVTIIRKIFTHAWDTELIPDQVRFGPEFKAPTGASIRKSQQACAVRNTFTADEIQTLLTAGDGTVKFSHMAQMRAMILLGINCAFGLTDCARLRVDQVRFGSDIGPHVNMPRPKTGIERFCPLWPQTIEALQFVSRVRHAAAGVTAFFTAEDGQSWMHLTQRTKSGAKRYTHHDRISKRFRYLRDQLKHTKKLPDDAPGFYKLRHTFRTLADECGDESAVAKIMGHQLAGLKATYVHRVNFERLERITNHVHAWLFQ